MSHAFSSLDELGDGPGFRKVRQPLGVTAFGVNALVLPPDTRASPHYHDTQDELYFVHRGRVQVDVDGETPRARRRRALPRRGDDAAQLSNPFDEEAVVFVVGGKDGYVERDGHLVDPDDVERRRRSLR